MSHSAHDVELADRKSRARAIVTALAAVYFLAIQPFVHPAFHLDRPDDRWRALVWVVNVALLLFLLVTPFVRVLGRRQLWELVNDDVTRLHSRTAAMVGFWVSMLAGLVLCALPLAIPLPAREAVYLVVTPAAGIALVVFAGLELRAHRDG